ncbi:MAG: VWA domain-containing protein [Candidatus Riflebacteria bacterium]|nr:VWA domain-containing protein [Candidatus Riflebacteria bacterium]
MFNKELIRLIIVTLVTILVPDYAVAMLCDGGGNPLTMVQQQVKIEIDNQVAIVRIEQKFLNPGDAAVECRLKFPLSEKASVQEFGLTDAAGNRQTGAIEEKNKAEEVYSSAVFQGFTPAIGKQTDENTFETKVGTVAPKSFAIVDLTYSEILTYKSGKVFFTLPLNISSIQSKALELLSVSLLLKDQKKIINFTSPSHSLTGTKNSDHEWNLVFEKSGYLPEKDFQIIYEVMAEKMGFSLMTTRPEENSEGYFMMLLAPQEVVKAEDIAARDIVFVMDVSGSMQGHKLDQTKEAFRFFVEQLNPDDNFNVIIFSGKVELLANGPMMPATEQNRREALKFIDGIRASGGTNIDQALQSALGCFRSSDRTRAIVFLTDGLPTVGETNIWKIASNYSQANTDKIRTFVFGVGNDLSTVLLDKLAAENMGESIYVRIYEDLKVKLVSFYETISKPLLTDVSVAIDGIRVNDQYPVEKINIYKGSQVGIWGRYSGSGPAKIVVSGLLNGQRQEYVVEGNFPQKKEEDFFVARLWAKARSDELIRQIRAEGSQNSPKIQEVISLSKKFSFTTPYTSFVAVSETRQNQYSALPGNSNSYQNRFNNAHNQPVAPVSQQNTVSNQNNYDSYQQNQAAYNSSLAPTQQTPRGEAIIKTSENSKPVQFWGAAGFFPAALLVPNFRKSREQARGKACYANMRVLLGAVEMYNMDNPVFITKIDEEAMKNLSCGYLKGPLNKPENKCGYYSAGDLTKPEGRIACALHGTVEDDTDLSKMNLNIIDNTPDSVKSWNKWQPLVETVVNIPLLLLGLYFSYLMMIKLPLAILMGFINLFRSSEPTAADGTIVLSESDSVPAENADQMDSSENQSDDTREYDSDEITEQSETPDDPESSKNSDVK